MADQHGPPPVIRLSTGPDLAAAVPHLLGFRPRESLVLVALTGDADRRVGVTLRVDLPVGCPDPGFAAAAIDRLGPAAGIAAIVVTDGPDTAAPPGPTAALLDRPVDQLGPAELRVLRTDAELPGRALVHDLVLAAGALGVPLLRALLVRAGRCWDYDCPHPCCDPGVGVPLPVDPGELAVAQALQGATVAADRSEIVARLAPASGPALLAMGRACARVGVEHADDLRLLGWDALLDRCWQRVRAAVAAHRPGTTAALSDDEVARLGWAVTATEVRDRALALATGPDAAAADAVWTELVRRLPGPLDATPATLLAASAYARGDGALAGIALDRALASQPHGTLAGLLQQALRSALPPAEVRDLLRRAGDPAQQPCSEQLGA
jgi:hypothetical protein